MPRIPESAVTVGVPFISSQPIRETQVIGGAVAGLTEAATEFASRRREAQRKVELTALSAEFESSLSDLQLDIQRDPAMNTVDIAEFFFTEEAGKLSENVLGQAQSAVVQDALRARINPSTLQARVAVGRVAFGRERDTAIAGLDSLDQELARKYVEAPNREARTLIRKDQFVLTNLSDYITEEAKGERIRAFAERTDSSLVQALIDTKRSDVALALVEDESRVQGLDFETRRKFKQLALADIRGVSAAELEILVSRGQTTEALIREARDRQVITSATMADWIKELDRVKAKQAKDQSGLIRAASAFTGEGLPLDPKDKDDKKGLDLFYQTFLVPQLEGLSGEQRSDAIVRLVSHAGIGMLPLTLQSEVRGKLRSGTESQVVEAADLIDRIQSETPRALDDLAPKDIGFGLNVARQVRAGITQVRAVERAKEVELIPESAQEVLRKSFRAPEAQDGIEEFLDDLSDVPGFFNLGTRELTPLFEGELRELAEIEFQRNGGQLDLALDVAQLQMERVWAQTRVDGGPTRMMKYAPEAVHTEFTGTDALREQLLDDVNENVLTPIPIEQIRLVTDLETARRVPRSYVVEIRQENQEWIPITDQGRLRRFHFDFPTSPEGRRRQQETEETLALSEQAQTSLDVARVLMNTENSSEIAKRPNVAQQLGLSPFGTGE